MYTIAKTDYGLRITMGGKYGEGEIARYVTEKAAMIGQIDGQYSILIDLRTAYPPVESDAEMLVESQRNMLATDVERMAVIVTSPVMKMSVTQVFFKSELQNRLCVIDAGKHPDWEDLALGWIEGRLELAELDNLPEKVHA